jgi:hypothetical protein
MNWWQGHSKSAGRKYITTWFDTTAFKTAHKDIYALFAKQIEARRFSVA